MTIVALSGSHDHFCKQIAERIVAGVFFVPVKVERDLFLLVNGDSFLASPLGIRITRGECCFILFSLFLPMKLFLCIHIRNNVSSIDDTHRAGLESVSSSGDQDVIKDILEKILLGLFIRLKNTILEERKGGVIG